MVFPLSKSESVEFLLIESVICLFTDLSVQKKNFTDKSVDNQFSLTNHCIELMKKYFSLLNKLISTEVISEI